MLKNTARRMTVVLKHCTENESRVENTARRMTVVLKNNDGDWQ
jgi:hypothetical protein